MPGRGHNSSLAAAISKRVATHPDSSLVGLRQLRRQITRELRQEDPHLIIDLVLELVANGSVPRWFAYEILSHNPAAIAAVTPAQLEQLGHGMASWDQVDVFACYLAGPAWREGQLKTTDIERWSRSEDRWWRRAALVSTVPLNNSARGGQGDAKSTLFVSDLLRHDRDDMVVKALSWALRELAKKEPRAVEQYLTRREGELPARVLREVRNKLNTGLKNPKPRRLRS